MQTYVDPEDPTQYVIPCKIANFAEMISPKIAVVAIFANGTVSEFNYESNDSLSNYCELLQETTNSAGRHQNYNPYKRNHSKQRNS